MKEYSYTKHAAIRVSERIPLSKSRKIVHNILTKENFIPIGYDLHKKHIKHCLFYLTYTNEYYVACVDERNNEIITILFAMDFKNWNIDSNIYTEAMLISLNFLLKIQAIKSLSKNEVFSISKFQDLSKFKYIINYLKRNNISHCFFEKESKKTNKKNNTKKSKNKDILCPIELRERRKKLFEENIKKSSEYIVTDNDKALVEKAKKEKLMREKEKFIMKEDNKEESKEKVFRGFKIENINLINFDADYFYCNFDENYQPPRNESYFNVFQYFNKCEFKLIRNAGMTKENYQCFLPSQEEIDFMFKYYLYSSQGKTISLRKFLKNCGYCSLNLNIFIFEVEKLIKNFENNNYKKTEELVIIESFKEEIELLIKNNN